jgi:hypothetical protein
VTGVAVGARVSVGAGVGDGAGVSVAVGVKVTVGVGVEVDVPVDEGVGLGVTVGGTFCVGEEDSTIPSGIVAFAVAVGVSVTNEIFLEGASASAVKPAQ